MILCTKCKRCGVSIEVKGETAKELDEQLHLCPACMQWTAHETGASYPHIPVVNETTTALTTVEGFNYKGVYNSEVKALENLKKFCVEK